MWTKLTDLKSAADIKLGNVESAKLQPTDNAKDDAARDALDEYSAVTPRQLVHEQLGDGTTRRFVLQSIVTGPPAWADGSSQLLTVQFVANPNTQDEEAKELDTETWELQQDTTGKQVLLLEQAPSTAETLRLTWTLPHTIEELDGAGPGTTTVPLRDRIALLLLVTAQLAAWVSRTASDQRATSMGIDQIDFRSIDDRWRRRSEELRKAAISRLGPGEINRGAAGASVDYETKTRLGRQPRVSH